MPDVGVLNTANGHHNEHDDFSPLDDMLPPHGISTSNAAGEGTDEPGLPVENVEEETKDEPPAQKAPSKTADTKFPATAGKKARVIIPLTHPFMIWLKISSY